jgi:hypothetical protein
MALTQQSSTKTSGGQLAQQMDKDPKDYDGGKLQQQVPEASNHYGDETKDLHPPQGASVGGKRKTGKKDPLRTGKNRTRKGKNRTQKKNKRSKTSKK